ncbi:unnamed protein product [Somion occarium]|uniref:Uncharacterized protein n=1 Tax=Somion occarium TaxID=3059160 RepID=A0ABP1DVV8_9APHY
MIQEYYATHFLTAARTVVSPTWLHADMRGFDCASRRALEWRRRHTTTLEQVQPMAQCNPILEGKDRICLFILEEHTRQGINKN